MDHILDSYADYSAPDSSVEAFFKNIEKIVEPLHISSEFEMEKQSVSKITAPYPIMKLYTASQLDIKIGMEGILALGPCFEENFSHVEVGGLKDITSVVCSHLSKIKDNRRFKFDLMKQDAILGHGSFGNVCKVQFGKKDYAVKQFSGRDDLKDVNAFKERDFLIYLKHKRIVNIAGAFHDRGNYLVLELCYNSLQRMIGLLNTKHKIRFGIQLLEAVNWIHSKRIIHCDIKPGNFLITMNNNLVLTDFGNSQLLPVGQNYVKADYQLSVSAFSDQLVLQENVYSKSSDVFAAACVLFFLERGGGLMKYSFPVENEEYLRVLREGRLLDTGTKDPVTQMRTEVDFKGKRETLEQRITAKPCLFGEVIVKMIDRNCKTRITAAAALKDESIKQLLIKNKIANEDIDSDPCLVTKTVHVNRNVETLKPSSVEPLATVKLMMNLLYYDEETADIDEIGKCRNLISGQELGQPPTAPSIPIDALQNLIQQYTNIPSVSSSGLSSIIVEDPKSSSSKTCAAPVATEYVTSKPKTVADPPKKKGLFKAPTTKNATETSALKDTRPSEGLTPKDDKTSFAENFPKPGTSTGGVMAAPRSVFRSPLGRGGNRGTSSSAFKEQGVKAITGTIRRPAPIYGKDYLNPKPEDLFTRLLAQKESKAAEALGRNPENEATTTAPKNDPKVVIPETDKAATDRKSTPAAPKEKKAQKASGDYSKLSRNRTAKRAASSKVISDDDIDDSQEAVSIKKTKMGPTASKTMTKQNSTKKEKQPEDEFLCEYCRDRTFPTFEECRAHMRICRQEKKMKEEQKKGKNIRKNEN